MTESTICVCTCIITTLYPMMLADTGTKETGAQGKYRNIEVKEISFKRFNGASRRQEKRE